MKKSMLTTIVVVFVMSSMSFGALLSFTASPGQISPVAGQTFQLAVAVNPSVGSAAGLDGNVQNLSFWLTTNAPAGLFAIMGRTVGTGFLTGDYQTTDASLFAHGSLPESGTGYDLGSAFTNPITADNTIIETLTIKAIGTPVLGTYTFTPFGVDASDDGFFESAFSAGTGARVNVVPEPFSIVLLSLGGLGLLRRRS